MSLSLFNQHATSYFFDKRLTQALSGEFCETVKNTTITEHLQTSASVFMGHTCNIIKLNVK